jgi:hypothetical protein
MSAAASLAGICLGYTSQYAKVTRVTRPRGSWTSFVEELATRRDVIERLMAVHLPNDTGLCVECTTPGHGTPREAWPCSLWTLADAARRFRAELAFRRARAPVAVRVDGLGLSWAQGADEPLLRGGVAFPVRRGLAVLGEERRQPAVEGRVVPLGGLPVGDHRVLEGVPQVRVVSGDLDVPGLRFHTPANIERAEVRRQLMAVRRAVPGPFWPRRRSPREGDSYLPTTSQNLRVSASCSYLDTRSLVRVHIWTNFASTTPLTP